MTLNLGLESLTVKEESPIVSFEELLQSELDFNDAYQAFVDYKNVCEIVVKAKASTESMKFASSLLNASVENIEVSVESLSDKLKAAWDKFVEMWKKFVGWFKGIIAKVKPTQLPVEVSPSTKSLEEIASFVKIEQGIDERRLKEEGARSWAMKDHAQRIAAAMKETETLNTIQNVNAWKRNAAECINSLSKRIAFLQKNFQKSKWSIEEPKVAARYYMSVGPKIIAKLQTTLNKLASVKESPKAESSN